MVGSTGGGGGDITSGEVQTMIDESISGKADTSAVTQSINAAVSGKIDSESAVTNVKVLTVSQQNEVQIAQSKGDSTASTFVGTVYRVGSGLTWNYQTKEFAVDSSTVALKSEVDAALSGKQDTLIEGRAIDITNNTVSLDLPISAGTGANSIMVGINCVASGQKSFVGGHGSTGQSEGSFAFGQNCKAGQWSIAVGNSVEANIAPNSAAFGKYNKQNGGFYEADSATTLFSVGNGSNATSGRHNAFEVRRNGDIYLTKDGQDVKLQDQLGGGEVSTAITSGDTNAVAGGAVYDKFDEVESVTAAALNVLNDKFDGLTLKKLTQAQYDALSPNYDNNTLYVII